MEHLYGQTSFKRIIKFFIEILGAEFLLKAVTCAISLGFWENCGLISTALLQSALTRFPEFVKTQAAPVE
jgi:hypothetical protein